MKKLIPKKMKEDFDIRFKRIIARLVDLNQKVINTNSESPVSNRNREQKRSPLPAFAEEMDFFSLNEWMAASDNCQPEDHEFQSHLKK